MMVDGMVGLLLCVGLRTVFLCAILIWSEYPFSVGEVWYVLWFKQ
jgi:hypothetical protein